MDVGENGGIDCDCHANSGPKEGRPEEENLGKRGEMDALIGGSFGQVLLEPFLEGVVEKKDAKTAAKAQLKAEISDDEWIEGQLNEKGGPEKVERIGGAAHDFRCKNQGSGDPSSLYGGRGTDKKKIESHEKKHADPFPAVGEE